jgi:hypothetical protein
VLGEFLGRPKVRALMEKDFVELAIDTDRMTHGKEVYEQVKAGRSGGLPWLVVLDATGKELICGIGEQGNIGAPVQPWECAHFVRMVRETRERLTDAEVQVIADELEAHAKPRRRPARDR